MMKKKYVLKNKKRFVSILFLTLIIIISAVYADIAYGYKEIDHKVVVVKQGDTLWDIANKYKVNEDIRAFIYKIKKLNKLSSSDILVGDEIVIPVK